MSKPEPDPRRQGGGRRKAESQRAAKRRERDQRRLAEEERRRQVRDRERIEDERREQERRSGANGLQREESPYRGRRIAPAPAVLNPGAADTPVTPASPTTDRTWPAGPDARTTAGGSRTRQGPPGPSDRAGASESNVTVGRQRAGAWRRALHVLGFLVWLGGLVAAALGFAERQSWLGVDDLVPRVGAAVATWVALIVLTRRCGGRPVLVGLFAASLLGLAAAFPENWALAGAAVVTATTYGLLGALLTRPAPGFRALQELLVAALIGLLGAVAVSGYDVSLRTLRFRVLVLAAVLVAGFALAWRLGHGARSLGRRGIVLIVAGALLIAMSIAYARAIAEWGSPEVVESVENAKDWMLDHLGAVPRPVEAFVGFPTLLWGVAIRARRRQGWWMCAFGALGATGVATAFVQKDADLWRTLLATGYNVVIGAVIGLLLVGIDRLLTGSGRRARMHGDSGTDRPEPARFAPLL